VATGRGVGGLEESKWHSYLQERQEVGSWELQTSQPHLGLWESDGAVKLGQHFQTQEGKEGDQEESARRLLTCVP